MLCMEIVLPYSQGSNLIAQFDILKHKRSILSKLTTYLFMYHKNGISMDKKRDSEEASRYTVK